MQKTNKEKAFLFYRILSTRTGGYESLLQAFLETGRIRAHKILSQSSDDKSQTTTKLFSKNVVNLDARMKEASVIFISTIDTFLTIFKVDETLPPRLSNLKSKYVSSWKDIEEELLKRSLIGPNDPTEIWAFQLHRNFDCSTIKVKKLLEKAKHSKLLLVSENSKPDFDGIDQIAVLQDTLSWDQVTESSQRRILSQTILDQGKPKKLKEFCKSYVYENEDLFYSEVLKGKLLASLLKEEVPVLFRSNIPPVKHYIPRCLRSRFYISTNIFHTNTNDEIFAFSGGNLDIEKLREIGSGSTRKIDTAANQLDRLEITAEYILLEFKKDFEKLCRKLEGKKTIHRLEVEQEKLVWQQTVGDKMICLQRNVYEAKQQIQIKEGEFLDVVDSSYENMPIILCDSAGMGKTVLLANLAQKTRKRRSEKSIVVFLVMTDFIVSLRKEIKCKSKYPNDFNAL